MMMVPVSIMYPLYIHTLYFVVMCVHHSACAVALLCIISGTLCISCITSYSYTVYGIHHCTVLYT